MNSAAENPPPHAAPPTEGRAEAISQLFREHNRALVNFLLTRLHDEQEAKEAAQEAYVKLLQLDQPVASGILRWYLFKIARCIAIDRQRQHSTRGRLDRLEVFDELDAGNPTEGQAMASDELARLQSALDELPRKHRRVFMLQRFEGLSTAQIAAQMGLTDRMIRHYIQRGLVYCRFRLEGASRADARREARI
jgi:RNA polymerase sigma-70 factor (ECF subfamily)